MAHTSTFRRRLITLGLVLLSLAGLLGYTRVIQVSQGGTGATTAADARTALGVAIGSDVQAYDADLTSWGAVNPSTWTGASSITTLGTVGTGTWQGTAVAVGYGGTGSSTAAGARDNILWSGAGSIACSSPCTPAAGVVRVTVTGTTIINLPALSGYANGQTLMVVCDSASSCTITGDPSDSGTCDGGSAGTACAAVTVSPHGTTGWIRTSASAWGSVQPGSVAVSRVVLDISGGAWRAAGYGYTPGGWVQITPFVAPEATGDPEGWGFSLSGTDISLTTGAGVINTVTRTEAPYWGWSLATLGVTLATPSFVRVTDTVTSITLTSPSAADYNGVGLTCGTSSDITTTGQYLHGIGVSNSNYARLSGNTTGVPTAYDVGSTMRIMRYASILPHTSGAAPTGYGYTAADAYLSSTTAPAIANGSVPTYLFVELIKLGTPRAGTISAPVITLNF